MLEIIKHAGAGHTGGGLSCIDILNVLYNRILNVSAATFADLPGFTVANVSVAYLDQNGATLANPGGSFNNIRYVQVQVTGYQHQLLIPMIFTSITVPAFRAVLPRESLGVVNGVSTSC